MLEILDPLPWAIFKGMGDPLSRKMWKSDYPYPIQGIRPQIIINEVACKAVLCVVPGLWSENRTWGPVTHLNPLSSFSREFILNSYKITPFLSISYSQEKVS
jgi:hypothetical protein